VTREKTINEIAAKNRLTEELTKQIKHFFETDNGLFSLQKEYDIE
jgi:hypothetical protein